MTSDKNALNELAEAFRVTTSYLDWNKKRVEVPESTIRAVLTALDVDLTDPAAAAQAVQDDAWGRLLPPTVMAIEGEATSVAAHAEAGASLLLSVELESGETRDLTIETAVTDTKTIGDSDVVALGFELPADLPLGYHTLRAEAGDRTAAAHLIVTPPRLLLPETLGTDPAWGFAAQLYSVRSRASWGVGDLADLAAIAEWSGGLGADYALINPVHAAEPIAPLEPSPYLPSSRRFFNPLYIHVEDVEEFEALTEEGRAAVEALAAEVHAEVDGSDTIDRDTSWTAKRAALELLHRVERSPERQRDFDDYRELHGESLVRFATWNALATEFGNDARQWPKRYHDSEGEAVAAYARDHETDIDFEMWLQWTLDQQLQSAQDRAGRAGMSLGIMHDLAVGVHPGGADAWRLRETYATGIRVGAPPDGFNQRGQDWGQPPWRPDRLAEVGYAPLRDLIQNVLRHAGGVRIDHIIGLFRLWWLPEGTSAAEGTYVRYDHEAMIGILVLEAMRAHAVIVGEDLGVVEDSAREYLLERGVLGTSILWFERDADGDPLPAEEWRELCLASATTHDLPPNAGYLTGEHVKLRDSLGLLTRPVEEEQKAAAQERDSWLDEVRSRGLLDDDADIDETVLALHRYLALAPSRLLGVALVDAVGDARTQNQPGTKDEYPNWRIPLSGPDGTPILLEDVMASDRPAAFARAVTERQASAVRPKKEKSMTAPDPIEPADAPHIPELEDDETVAPRPEEEVADVARAKPDLPPRQH